MEIDHEKTGPLIPFVGLQNIGNSCYLNSILQVLLYCPGFLDRLKEVKKILQCEAETTSIPEERLTNNFNIVKELDLLYGEMFTAKSKILKILESNTDKNKDLEFTEALRYVRPSKFFQCFCTGYPLFEAHTQQDAQECLHCILSACDYPPSLDLAPEVDASKKQKSVKVFGGHKLRNTLMIKQNFSSQSSTAASNLKQAAVKNSCKDYPKVPESLSTSIVSTSCLKRLKRKRVSSSDHHLQENKENICLGTNYTKDTDEPPSKNLRTDTGFAMGKYPKKPVSGYQKLIKFRNKFIKRQYRIQTNTSKNQPKKDNQLQINNLSQIINSGHMSNKDKSIKQLFYGHSITTIKCLECENQVERLESFQDISLPVKPSTQDRFRTKAINETSGSLSWALTKYTAQELLDGDNKYFCNSCLRLTEGGQCTKFKQLPPIVTFHLKQFSNALDCNGCETTVSKITSSFKIPRSIDLREWCTGNCNQNTNYALFAIVIHSGAAITGGHYLSYVKIREKSGKISEDKWLRFDDEDVRVLSEDCVNKALNGDFGNFISRSPYLLFYQQTEVSF